ncbi:hypothetical protein Tco_1010544 [Tanacetum coccineum]
MISPEKVALEDLLKRANTEFPNDEKVIELYAKYERLFKEAVFSEDSQAHLDDFDNDDGGGDNDDDGSDNVEKEKKPASEAAVNAEKESVFNFGLGLDVDVCILVITDGHSTNILMKKYEQVMDL